MADFSIANPGMGSSCRSAWRTADPCSSRTTPFAAWIHAAVEFAAVGVIESLGASFDDEGLELACARMRAAAIQAMGDELGRIQLEAN